MPQRTADSRGPVGHQLVALRTRRYYQALRWLIVTLVRLNAIRFAIIVGLVAVGRSLQAAAFAGVIWYFSAVEDGAPIELLDRSVDPRDWSIMAMVIASVAMAMVAATFVIYVSAHMGFRLSMLFADDVVKRVLDQERTFPSRTTLASDGSMSLQALQLLKAKVFLFRPVNVLLSLPRLLLLGLPSIAGMIWISGEVVAFLTVLAIPAVALNYIISHRVIIAQRLFGKKQQAYKKAVVSTAEAIAAEGAPNDGRAALSDELTNSTANAEAKHAYQIRILSPRQSEFVSNVVAAVAIAAIGFYFGYEALTGAMPLAVVIGFFVLLRLTISALTGISVSLTSYARFYGTVRSAYEYLTSPVANPKPFSGHPVLHAAKSDDPVPGAIEDGVKVERGKPVAIVSPAKLNRFTQYFFVYALTQRSRQSTRENLNAATMRCTPSLAEPASLQALGLASMDAATLASRCKGTPVEDVAPTVDDIRKAVSGEPLKRESFARLALLACLVSSADCVVIHQRVLQILDGNEARLWLDALKDRFIAVAYQSHRFETCLAGESYAVLLDYDHVVALVRGKDAPTAAPLVKERMKATEAESDEDTMEE